MATNQESLQASIRLVTGTSYNYDGDWMALFDLYGIAQGAFDCRMISWLRSSLNSTKTNINDLQAEYAISLGLSRWTDITSIAPALSGLTAWYDFTNSSYLTLSSTAITQALDRSGNGNHTAVQGTSTARMAFTANQINGLPGAVADGGDFYMMPSMTLGAVTVFVVAANTNTFPIGGGDIDALLEHSGFAIRSANGFTTTANPIFQTQFFTTPVMRLNGTIVSNPQNTVVNTPYIYNVTDPDNASSTGTSGLFATSAGAAIMPGKLYEVLIYNRALTDAEIGQVNRYLSQKYAITIS